MNNDNFCITVNACVNMSAIWTADARQNGGQAMNKSSPEQLLLPVVMRCEPSVCSSRSAIRKENALTYNLIRFYLIFNINLSLHMYNGYVACAFIRTTNHRNKLLCAIYTHEIRLCYVNTASSLESLVQYPG